jgi:hypothetical protein
MEAVLSSSTSVSFYLDIFRCMQQVSIVPSHHHDNHTLRNVAFGERLVRHEVEIAWAEGVAMCAATDINIYGNIWDSKGLRWVAYTAIPSYLISATARNT